ncbi:MAG: MBOAT family protein [Gammaproteobacteria bacterium]|nr:MBOAT family protein [Gammaproteobacteria bacterium]
MLFTTQLFLLVFLPLTACAYHLADTRRARLWVLLISSLVFYGWWDVRFLPLLIVTGVVNWSIAQSFRRAPRDGLIWAGVVFNLGVLAVFKYTNFIAASVLELFAEPFTPWPIVLPLGVSFFTFQQVSYLLDVRRGQAAEYDFLDFACYVCFFPHLIAGPIIRHHELIPQFAALVAKHIDREMVARGLLLFVLGLVKKVWLADQLAPFADDGFAAAAPGTALAWQAALAYSLQLYFDFSGYSDMALGLAGMFGLSLPINFDAPYRATSIREFWRRWHMTLSRFLRDYLYIPLGGSRAGPLRAYAAALGTMLLCGLWHGAGWTFIAWGGLHGVAVCCNRWWLGRGLRLPALPGWALTMLFVIAGWVLFRADDFHGAARMLSAMAGQGGSGAADDDGWAVIALAAALAIGGPTNLELSRKAWPYRPVLAVPLALLLLVTVLRVGQGRGIEFIYFQF